MKPIDVSENDEKHLLATAYNQINKHANVKTKFKIGDNVRISKYRSTFAKGYTPNWTNEIFVIRKVQFTNPVTYLLRDLKK